MTRLAVLVLTLLPALAAAQTPPPRPAQNVVPPRLISRVEPAYPVEVQRERIQGLVGLEVIIGADGSVVAVKVGRSLDPRLDAAAMDAVKQWRYEPATVDGAPVRMVARISVSFALRGSPPLLEWPAGFTAPRDGNAPEPQWREDTAVASGLEFRIAYPDGSLVQKFPASTARVASVRSGSGWRDFSIMFPRPSILTLDRPFAVAELQKFADDVQRVSGMRGTTPIGTRATGQVERPGGGYWIWYQTEMPTKDLTGLPAVAGAIFETAHFWMFTTTVGRQMVMVGCNLLLPAILTAAEREQQTRDASGECGEMIRRLSIRPAQ